MNALAARIRKPSRWVLPSAPDPAAVAALASELHLPPVICELLLRRGHDTPELAKRYLRPRLDQLQDPARMLGMDVAVERLSRAIGSGERIVIHGDYDVDGMCSTTVLLRTIRKLGGDAQPFIPRRIEDGYDLTMAGVNAAIAANANVLVTCDCGTNALAPVEAACKAGLDVIITDHHLPSGPLPECLTVLNPKRDGCDYPDKDLAAVGIAFKLSLALTRAMGGNEDDVYGLLDLVALATIADVAPLRGENRVLGARGAQAHGELAERGAARPHSRVGARGKIAQCRSHRLHPRAAIERRRAALATHCVVSSCSCPRTITRPTRLRASSRSSTAIARKSIARHTRARASSSTRSISTRRTASCSPKRGGIPA